MFISYAFQMNGHHDSVSEWLRRWTRNPLGSAREGSNPFAVAFACTSHTTFKTKKSRKIVDTFLTRPTRRRFKLGELFDDSAYSGQIKWTNEDQTTLYDINYIFKLLGCPSGWGGGLEIHWSPGRVGSNPTPSIGLLPRCLLPKWNHRPNSFSSTKHHQRCVPYGVWTHDPWLIRPML